MQPPSALLNPNSKNKKKITSKKSSHILLHFRKWNFLPDIKKFLIFSSKKAFLIFWETETTKMKLSYISGNRNPKKLLTFQEVTFQARNIKPTFKKFFKFGNVELSSSKLKKLLIFQEGAYKAPKTT